MRLLRTLLAAAAAAALLAACSQPAPQSSPETATTAPAGEQPAATAGAGGAYPGPSGAYPAPSGAYPGPQTVPTPAVSMDPIVVPQPASNEVGVVSGTLYRLDEAGKRIPYAAGTIYLGTVTESGGVEAMVALDRNVAPTTVTNGLGQFVFADVPPGRYGLMLQAFEGPLLLNNPQDATDMLIEVTGGQVVEMGDLAYPLPNPLE